MPLTISGLRLSKVPRLPQIRRPPLGASGLNQGRWSKSAGSAGLPCMARAWLSAAEQGAPGASAAISTSAIRVARPTEMRRKADMDTRGFDSDIAAEILAWTLSGADSRDQTWQIRSTRRH